MSPSSQTQPRPRSPPRRDRTRPAGLGAAFETSTRPTRRRQVVLVEVDVGHDSPIPGDRAYALMTPAWRRSAGLDDLARLDAPVQTFTRFAAPLTRARTRWMFGCQRRFVRRCDCETDRPHDGCLPHTSLRCHQFSSRPTSTARSRLVLPAEDSRTYPGGPVKYSQRWIDHTEPFDPNTPQLDIIPSAHQPCQLEQFDTTALT